MGYMTSNIKDVAIIGVMAIAIILLTGILNIPKALAQGAQAVVDKNIKESEEEVKVVQAHTAFVIDSSNGDISAVVNKNFSESQIEVANVQAHAQGIIDFSNQLVDSGTKQVAAHPNLLSWLIGGSPVSVPAPNSEDSIETPEGANITVQDQYNIGRRWGNVLIL